MDQKSKPFTGVHWNWADPSGYGVPGRPITQDQFYTEDVFLMLVPDDGLRPKRPRATDKQSQDAPPAPQPSPWQPGRAQQIRPHVDYWMERNPQYDNDRPMEINPDADPLCWDKDRVQGIIDAYVSHLHLRDEALIGLASAASDIERAQWQEEVRRQEGALAELKPLYDRAVKCKPSDSRPGQKPEV